MKFIVVTIEWMSAHGLTPLPTMRKSKDGSKIILHEDYFMLVAKRDEEGNLLLEGAEVYAHNSKELQTLLNSDEWTWSEEAPTESADFIQVAAVRNLMTATKAGIQNYSMSNKEVNNVVDMLPKWEDLIGQSLPIKYKLQYDGKPYRTNQAHTPQLDWKPSEVKNLYGLISNHNGTINDPIPYEHWLVLDKGLYYTENEVIYKCITDSIVGYDADLSTLGSLVEKVEEEKSFNL